MKDYSVLVDYLNVELGNGGIVKGWLEVGSFFWGICSGWFATQGTGW